jgi:hypothetical protein
MVDAPIPLLPADLLERVSEALRCAGVAARPDHAAPVEAQGLTWTFELEWRTAVLGAFVRRVLERAELHLVPGPRGHQVVLSCEPVRTHEAHAAGAALVLVLAVAAWLLAGWSTIGVPVGLTTLLAGGSLVTLARRMALLTLERRLRRLGEDVATAIIGSDRSPIGL